jgi:hypothetical protein
MKTGILRMIFCAAIVLLFALLFLKNRETTLPVLTETNATRPAVTSSIVPARPPAHTNLPPIKPAMNTAQPLPLSQADQKIEMLSTYNDQPIVFYGKIQDQFTNAVSDAVVSFEVRINNGYESTVQRGRVVADGNGLFTISGYKGERLGLGVAKAGYVWISMSGSGIYSKMWPEDQRAHPDPDNPTVIKMWKLQGAEPLFAINEHYKLPFTKDPIFFDLIGGKVVPEGGDLEIKITRAAGLITQRKQDHRNWSIELIPVDGGIMEPEYNTSHVTFAAPVSGYQDNYLVQMKHDSLGWFDNIQKAFLMNSRNNQIYSKFSFDFEINDDPNGTMWFQFKGVANTNSSRNWEATAPQ